MVNGLHGIIMVRKNKKSSIKKVKKQVSGIIIPKKVGKRVLFHTRIIVKMENLLISFLILVKKSVKKVGKGILKMVCGRGGVIKVKRLEKEIIKLVRSMGSGQAIMITVEKLKKANGKMENSMGSRHCGIKVEISL